MRKKNRESSSFFFPQQNTRQKKYKTLSKKNPPFQQKNKNKTKTKTKKYNTHLFFFSKTTLLFNENSYHHLFKKNLFCYRYLTKKTIKLNKTWDSFPFLSSPFRMFVFCRPNCYDILLFLFSHSKNDEWYLLYCFKQSSFCFPSYVSIWSKLPLSKLKQKKN